MCQHRTVKCDRQWEIPRDLWNRWSKNIIKAYMMTVDSAFTLTANNSEKKKQPAGRPPSIYTDLQHHQNSQYKQDGSTIHDGNMLVKLQMLNASRTKSVRPVDIAVLNGNSRKHNTKSSTFRKKRKEGGVLNYIEMLRLEQRMSKCVIITVCQRWPKNITNRNQQSVIRSSRYGRNYRFDIWSKWQQNHPRENKTHLAK